MRVRSLILLTFMLHEFGGTEQLHAELRLNELLVINVAGPEDRDGDLPAWVEIINGDDSPVRIEDFYLTDDPDDLTKWRIPRKTVAGNGRSLIYLSGKGSNTIASNEVHADFKFTDRDDYLALIGPDGTEVVTALRDIPKQRTGFSYGLREDTLQLAYFRSPTPTLPNRAPVSGFVADTEFTVDRGFFDEPFQVEISTDTPDATILYTLDGTPPSKGNLFTGPIGEEYLGPITIDATTVLRAFAFKTGLGSSDVDTQTYLFIDDVIEQDTMRTSITSSDEYGPQMRKALTDLPSISLAVEDPEFVGSGNSNTNDEESTTSVEWLNPDGSEGFQIDGGISRFGGYFTNFAKKSLRLYFRKRYGDSKLEYPIFRGHESGRAPVEEFDSLNLRSGSHDMVRSSAYMSNRFVDDSMLEMGGIAPHGRFVHVYLNGVYWGQYHLRERWNAAMFASYFGGSEEDYDAINGNDNFLDDFKAFDGNLEYWRETEALSREGTPWQSLQGRVDLADYYDFMILWASGDSESEFQSVGSRSRGIPFKFYMKDADGWLRPPSTSGRVEVVGPGRFNDVLRREANPDYVQFFADRIHKHYRNRGALTDRANIARLQRRVDEISTAFLAEAARWDYSTPQSWRRNQDNLLERHFDGLAETMIRRFMLRGFYPVDILAPTFSQHGGQLITGTRIRLSAGMPFNPQAGDFLYTTNGVDPRLPGGARSSNAIVYDRSSPGISLKGTTHLKARTFDQGKWSPLTEATFYLGKRPSPGDLLISEIHYRPAPPTDAEIAAGFSARSDFEFLEIFNTSDQNVGLFDLAFTKGIRFDFDESSLSQLQPGKVALLVRNRLAFAQRYGEGLPIAGEYTKSKLSDDGETLQLALSNGTVMQELTYDDNEPWPNEADGSGKSLSLAGITPLRWSASASLGGTPGEFSVINDDPDQDGDRLSALLEAALGTSDQDPTSGPAAFRLTTETRDVEGLERRYLHFVTQKNSLREDLTLHLEVSADLQTWQSGDTTFVLEEQNDNQFVWRSKLPLDQLENVPSYLRLRASDS